MLFAGLVRGLAIGFALLFALVLLIYLLIGLSIALQLLSLSGRLNRRIRLSTDLYAWRRVLRRRVGQLGAVHLNLIAADPGTTGSVGIGQCMARHNLAGLLFKSLDRKAPVHDMA